MLNSCLCRIDFQVSADIWSTERRCCTSSFGLVGLSKDDIVNVLDDENDLCEYRLSSWYRNSRNRSHVALEFETSNSVYPVNKLECTNVKALFKFFLNSSSFRYALFSTNFESFGSNLRGITETPLCSSSGKCINFGLFTNHFGDVNGRDLST